MQHIKNVPIPARNLQSPENSEYHLLEKLVYFRQNDIMVTDSCKRNSQYTVTNNAVSKGKTEGRRNVKNADLCLRMCGAV
jgi:hypothetical protein